MFFFFFFSGKIRIIFFFFFSSRRRHTRLQGDWSSDVCSSDLFTLFRTSRSTPTRWTRFGSRRQRCSSASPPHFCRRVQPRASCPWKFSASNKFLPRGRPFGGPFRRNIFAAIRSVSHLIWQVGDFASGDQTNAPPSRGSAPRLARSDLQFATLRARIE